MEKPIPKVTQQNQYDIDFLFERARKRGYVLFVQEADKKAGRPRQLYFGPSQQKLDASLRPEVLELRWGASMIEFKPRIATANQVTSVTVKGWNRTHKTAISRTVTIDDKRLNLNEDLKRIVACGGRKEIVVKEPVFTNCEARAGSRDPPRADQAHRHSRGEGRRPPASARRPTGDDHPSRRTAQRALPRHQDGAHDR